MSAHKLSQIHFDSCLTTNPNTDYNHIENILVSSYEECIPLVRKKTQNTHKSRAPG